MAFRKRQRKFTKRFRRYRKRFQKRFNKSRFGYRAQGMGITQTTPFPKSSVARLRYCQKGAIDSGGTIAVNLFRANSCFDPYQTGGGHQPMGFDQYSLIYNKYCVLGSKIKVTFWSEDAATNYAGIAGIYLTDDTTITASGGDVTVLMEQGKSNHKLMYTNPDHSGAITTVTQTFSAKKWFGYPNPKQQSTLVAATGANPSEEAIYCVWVGSPDGMTNLPELEYMVTIEYFVRFTEPVEFVQS